MMQKLFSFFTDSWRFYFINFIFEHKGVLPNIPLSVLCEFCWFSSPPGLGWDLFPCESHFIISDVVVQHLDNGQEMLTRIPSPHFEKVKDAFLELYCCALKTLFFPLHTTGAFQWIAVTWIMQKLSSFHSNNCIKKKKKQADSVPFKNLERAETLWRSFFFKSSGLC